MRRKTRLEQYQEDVDTNSTLYNAFRIASLGTGVGLATSLAVQYFAPEGGYELLNSIGFSLEDLTIGFGTGFTISTPGVYIFYQGLKKSKEKVNNESSRLGVKVGENK